MSTDPRLSDLSDSEERLRLLDENVRDYAIFMADATGLLRTWNVGVERLLGYREEEFVGAPFAIIFSAEDQADGAAARELETARTAGRAEDERWHVRKDGSRFWAMGVLTCLRDPDTGDVRGFAKIMRDITDRKLAEEERKVLLAREENARQEAEAANRVRDQFLATLSHELRTPLNAVLGWARLLLQLPPDDARTRTGLETIARNAQLQASLIDDLLDVSRMLAGTFVVERRTTDLVGIVQASVDSISPSARAKGIAIELRLHPLEAAVAGDRRRLHQILWNLLSNAVKFTPRDGRIVIEMHQQAGDVVLTVTDSGHGIAPEFLPHVFDPFRQEGGPAHRERTGMGLGLAIVRHLVAQHGGTITAHSDGPGSGAVFTVVLPATAAPADARTVGPDHASPSALTGVAVLVVEDDHDSREVLIRVLELAGAAVRAYDNAAEALASLSDQMPTVILCDIGLPGFDGLAFVEALRALPPEAGGRVPAAALTAYASPADRLRALQAGFQMHLANPLEPTDVVAAVATLAGRPL